MALPAFLPFEHPAILVFHVVGPSVKIAGIDEAVNPMIEAAPHLSGNVPSQPLERQFRICSPLIAGPQKRNGATI